MKKNAIFRGQEVLVMHQGWCTGRKRSDAVARISREGTTCAVDIVTDILLFATSKGWDAQTIVRMALEHHAAQA